MSEDTLIDRRSFLKMASLLSGIPVAGLGGLSALFSKSANASMSAGNIASLLSIDPITLEYLVFGPCCIYCPNYLIVKHYQPVILVEVIRGAADSLFTGSGSEALAPMGVTVHTKHKKNFAVRLWEIPDWAIDLAMGFQSCKLCGKEYAPTNDAGNPASSFLSSLCSADSLITEGLGAFNDALPECFPKLLYDSNMDVDWRTGCSDTLKVNPAASLACSASGGIQSLGIEIPGISEYCIGNWGPLYPRQMSWMIEDPKMGAAIAAMRGLNLAAEKGYVDYSVKASLGKLQLTSPTARPGFKAGTTAGRTSIQTSPVSPNGVYAFVWWLPVTCCKSITEISGLCTPVTGCVSG